MMSPYFRNLRAKIGHDLLLLTGVAAVIRDREDRLLLQERATGEGWSLPAGAVEPGEAPDEALKREVLEETNLLVVPTRLLGVFGGQDFRYVYPNGDAVEYTVVLYRCAVVGEGAGTLDPETAAIRYFARADMPRLALPYPTGLLFSG